MPFRFEINEKYAVLSSQISGFIMQVAFERRQSRKRLAERMRGKSRERSYAVCKIHKGVYWRIGYRIYLRKIIFPLPVGRVPIPTFKLKSEGGTLQRMHFPKKAYNREGQFRQWEEEHNNLAITWTISGYTLLAFNSISPLALRTALMTPRLTPIPTFL